MTEKKNSYNESILKPWELSLPPTPILKNCLYNKNLNYNRINSPLFSHSSSVPVTQTEGQMCLIAFFDNDHLWVNSSKRQQLLRSWIWVSVSSSTWKWLMIKSWQLVIPMLP